MENNTFDNVIHIQDNKKSLWDTIKHVIDTEKQEYPFYVCDVNDIIRKYKNWKEAMPRVYPHYAVKCNDHPIVLKVIATLGLGFDCASRIEIDKVLALGVDPSRIIFAHTAKSPAHLRHAAEVNVDLMTFDNEHELYKIKKLYPGARTVIRIRHDGKSAVCFGAKFGCDPETEALPLLQIARKLEINVVGVSFHVGWGCDDPSAYYGAIEAARSVFETARSVNYNFHILDIGGGYPGNLESSIAEYGKMINGGLEKFFPDESVRVISEPGTYFVESAFTLCCYVHSSKKVNKTNLTSGKLTTQYMYYVNDGVFGSFSIQLSTTIRKIPELLKNYPDSKQYQSTIWGPTCDSTDMLLENILLPELQLGDWLVFRNMGAYTLSVATAFNNIELPKVYSIINQENQLMLRGQIQLTKGSIIEETQKNPSKDAFNLQEDLLYEIPACLRIRG